MSEGKITKVHTFTKYLFQCFLVLVEFGGVSAAFVYITSLIVPCTTVIDCLERGTLGLVEGGFNFIQANGLDFICAADFILANARISLYTV